jgi:hypothetical protein
MPVESLGGSAHTQIGNSAHVEMVQSLYPSITPDHVKTEGGEPQASPSRPLVTPQHHGGVHARLLPEVLTCCGMVQRQPGVADAMIEATLSKRRSSHAQQ